MSNPIGKPTNTGSYFSNFQLPSVSQLCLKIQEIAKTVFNKIKEVFSSIYTYARSFIYAEAPAKPSTPSPFTEKESNQSPTANNLGAVNLNPSNSMGTDEAPLPVTPPGDENLTENNLGAVNLNPSNSMGTDEAPLPVTPPGDENLTENDLDAANFNPSNSMRTDEAPLPVTPPDDENLTENDLDAVNFNPANPLGTDEAPSLVPGSGTMSFMSTVTSSDLLSPIPEPVFSPLTGKERLTVSTYFLSKIQGETNNKTTKEKMNQLNPLSLLDFIAENKKLRQQIKDKKVDMTGWGEKLQPSLRAAVALLTADKIQSVTLGLLEKIKSEPSDRTEELKTKFTQALIDSDVKKLWDLFMEKAEPSAPVRRSSIRNLWGSP